MLTCLNDVVTNADIAENFTIMRNPGAPGAGGWQGSAPQAIAAYGTVGLASPRAIDALPEADRVGEIRAFHSTTRMYVTSNYDGITSDVLVWRGQQYRVLQAPEQPQRGYYAAIAARMEGN